MADGLSVTREDFTSLLIQLVGPEVALVTAALAEYRVGEGVLATVGFDPMVDEPQVRQRGVSIGTPPVATALSLNLDLMAVQIDNHPDADLMVAALDTSGRTAWAESMLGVNHFLSGGSSKQRRAVVAVSQAALQSASQSEFRAAAAEHWITDIIFTPYAAGMMATPLALLRLEPTRSRVTPSPTRVASLSRDARSRMRLATEIGATLAGSPHELGLLRMATLPEAATPWDRRNLDGRREDLVRQASSTPGTRALSEVVEILIAGRQSGSSNTSWESVLKASQVASPLPGPDELDLARVSDHALRMRPGDVVGKTMAPVRWAVAGELQADVPVGNGVVILRDKGQVAPELLAAYLNSSTAQALNLPVGTVMPKLRRQDLSQLPVPDLGALGLEGNAPEDLDQINRSVLELLAAGSALEGQLDDAFRTFDSTLVMEGIRETADRARLLRSQLRRQLEPARAYQDTYPHPIARALRQYRMEDEPLGRHGAMVRLVEAIVVTLGSVGVAWAHGTEGPAAEVEKIEILSTAWRRGGPSLGHWVGALDQVGNAARRQGQDALGLAEGTRRLKGARGLIPDLEALVAWRNSAVHGGGPRSRGAAVASVAQAAPTLDSALEGCAFLSDSQWVLAEAVDWDRRQRRFDVSGRSLTGDHPDFERVGFSVDEPQSLGLIYVRQRDGRGSLLLHPFVTLQICDTCGNEEIYYVDRIGLSRVQLVSFTTGHRVESDSLMNDLQRVGATDS